MRKVDAIIHFFELVEPIFWHHKFVIKLNIIG